MHCISPIKASFDRAGNITHNSKNAVKGLLGFEFECRGCLPCRLNIAREKSIRATHEAQTHKTNIFLTLTYDDDHVLPELHYRDFQLFIKKLRQSTPNKVTYMVTGEYGEKTHRPHWHALIFNYRPTDERCHYKTKLGHQVYQSPFLTNLWGMGNTDYGEITLESAGYVARYASKKLVHGKDQEHDLHPIHKTSSKRAIGRTWIEKYYKHTFENGFVVLPNSQIAKIPRYYVDWLKKHHPKLWHSYVTELRPKIMAKMEKRRLKEETQYNTSLSKRPWGAPHPQSRNKIELKCLEQKFKQLQENIKL